MFTRDIDKIFRAYRDLEVGTVLANEVPTFRADHMPYGGVKDSGLGREGVRYAIEEMTELKLLVLNLRPRVLQLPPHRLVSSSTLSVPSGVLPVQLLLFQGIQETSP